MRNKFIILVIAIAVLVMLAMPGPVFAKSLFYAENPSTLVVATGSTLNSGTQMVTGHCRVQSITIGGTGTTAGDYALVYDNTSATGTPIFEISVGTAKDTRQLVFRAAQFVTGIFVDSNSDSVTVTIEYTQ